MARLLLVDPDPDQRRILSAILCDVGFDVAVAETGRTAISQAIAVRPDLILMEAKLPDMDHLVAAEIIKALPGFDDIAIICLTSDPRIEVEFVLRRGCNTMLRKPIAPAALLTAIRAELHSLDVSAN